MKMKYARRIINNELTGYMVHFEHVEGRILRCDHFPDKHAGEELIKSENEAWALARDFAANTKHKCVNIYVIGSNFYPVAGYEKRKIENR